MCRDIKKSTGEHFSPFGMEDTVVNFLSVFWRARVLGASTSQSSGFHCDNSVDPRSAEATFSRQHPRAFRHDDLASWFFLPAPPHLFLRLGAKGVGEER